MTPDNRIVVGGAFTRFDTSNHVGVTRLRANGDLDPLFNPGSGVGGGPVRAVAVQTDGRILLGGGFVQVGGNPHAHLARLQTNGLADGTFTTSADGPVYALALQSDGRILVGGAFTNVAGAVRPCLARLMPNGAPDGSFGPGAGLDGPVYSIALQADGRIVVGGVFLTAGGSTNREYLVRLNSDGSVDPSFNSGLGIRAASRSASGAVPPPVLMPNLPRIVGGSPTTIDKFPYQVAIIDNPYNPNNIFYNQFCGGSILNEQWILTAAHCMAGQLPGGVAVAVGVTDLTRPQSGRIFLVDRIIVHPAYNPSTTENDVALMHLVEPIDFFGGYVAAPVPIVTPADVTAGLTDPGVLSTITGWGNTSGTGAAYPTNLYVATVPITTTSAYPPGQITPDMIMAGYVQGGVDTCQGDSGGPLVVTNGTGVILQAGITSWGNGCARPNYPGVYTRVSYFYNFISTNTVVTNAPPGPEPGTPAGVYAVAVAPNGRILIGGNFTSYNGTPRNFFARIRVDGALDFSFDIGSGANNLVRALAVQSDTAVMIGGDFTVVNDIPRSHLARVHGDERVDRVGVEFAASAFRVKENQGPAVIVIQRTGNTNADFTVSFGTSDGTATNPLDYGGVTNALHFVSGELAKTNLITILDDSLVEGNETVNLALFDAPPSVDLSGNVNAVLVIEDDEKSVRFSSTNYVVRENQTNAIIEVLREGDLSGQISVSFLTFPGTATPAADYTPVQTDLVFADSQTNQYVLIPVVYDNLEEVVETVSLALTNPVNCFMGIYPNATLKILDADVLLGTPDPSFDPGLGAGTPGGSVRALALSPDGKVLVGGAFTVFNKLPRNYITRLNVDGSQDLAFDPGTGANGMVSAVGTMMDGRALMGGAFTSVNGFGFTRVGRLLTNGAADINFGQLNSLNAPLTALVPLHDGKVLVAGGFTQPKPFLARVRTDGGVDSTFSAGAGPDAIVHSICLASNGAQPQIILGGAFGAVDGYPRARVARLATNGVVDPGFIPPVISTGIVYSVAADAEGRVLLGGSFTNVGGVTRRGLARLLPDGSLDQDFGPAVDGTVFSIVVQPSGKLLIGGSFTSVNQTNRGNLARLRPDGTLDANFAAGIGANGTVFSIVQVSDNSVLIGGAFTAVDGVARGGVARLIGEAPPPLQLTLVIPGPGQVKLVFNSQPGQRYLIQATTDLLNWADVTTVTATGYTTEITDPAAAGFLFRFYRVTTL